MSNFRACGWANIDPREVKIKQGYNPREDFETGMEEMIASIRTNGFYSHCPLTISQNDEEFVLIDGERRLRAVMFLINEGVDIKTVPVRVEKNLSEDESLVRSYVSNDGLKFNPIEEGKLFIRLQNMGWELKDIASKIGKSEMTVLNRIKLINSTTASEKKEILEGKKGITVESSKTKQRKEEEKQIISDFLEELDVHLDGGELTEDWKAAISLIKKYWKI